jgi:hypothetical protein
MSGAQRRWEHSIPQPAGPESADKSKMGPPQAFLSYAWEGDQHANWVLSLAGRLQGESGVRVVLDLCDLPPGSDQASFMERGIANSEFVIVICTPAYAEKANGREGGVGFESMVIVGELARRIESRKFIPVLRSGDWKSSLPIYLRSKHGVDLRNDPYSETQYDQLVRALHCEPVRLPPIGPKPEFAALRRATTTTQRLPQPPGHAEHEATPNLVQLSASDPGPCIEVTVTNSRDVIEAGRAIGLEYPAPIKMKALLDSGASVTVISKTFAKYCKLMQTGETEIRALGGLHKCGEHAAAISFPGTSLRSIDPIRIVSADFIKEPYYACLIGRDILRGWKVTFDGRSNRVTITDQAG